MTNPFRRLLRRRETGRPAPPWLRQVEALAAWTPPEGVDFLVGLNPATGVVRFSLVAGCVDMVGTAPESVSLVDLHGSLDAFAARVLRDAGACEVCADRPGASAESLTAAHAAFVAGIGAEDGP